jgi:hypothetical protein
MERKDISANAKLVLAVLHAYAGGKKTAWPSMLTIAEALGITDRTVQRCIVELERTGDIRHHRQDGHNVYYLYHARAGDKKSPQNTTDLPSTTRQDVASDTTDLPTKRTSENYDLEEDKLKEQEDLPADILSYLPPIAKTYAKAFHRIPTTTEVQDLLDIIERVGSDQADDLLQSAIAHKNSDLKALIRTAHRLSLATD